MSKPSSNERSSKAPATPVPKPAGSNGADSGRTVQNDRAAPNQAGMGSRAGQRDMTSGKRSGNQ